MEESCTVHVDWFLFWHIVHEASAFENTPSSAFSPQIVGCTGNGRVFLIIVDIACCMYQNQTSRLVIL